MSVKGGLYAHAAYEAKKKMLCEYLGPTSFLYIHILLIHILLLCVCVCCTGPERSLCTHVDFFFSSGTPNLMAIWREKGLNRGRVASLVDSHMQVKK